MNASLSRIETRPTFLDISCKRCAEPIVGPGSSFIELRAAGAMTGVADDGGAVVAGGGVVVVGGGAVVGGVPDKVQNTTTTQRRLLPSSTAPVPMAFQVGLLIVFQWPGLAANAAMTLARSGP